MRFPIVAATVVVTLLSTTAAMALAQGAAQVRAGSEVDVANDGECRPDADVALFFEGVGVSQVEVGSAVSDAGGSFETSVVIPAEAAEGAAAILVDCGLDGAVLTYDLEVVGSGFSLGGLAAPALVGLAVVVIVGLLALVRRRRPHGAAGTGDDSAGGDLEGVATGLEDVATGAGDESSEMSPAPLVGAVAVADEPVPAIGDAVGTAELADERPASDTAAPSAETPPAADGHDDGGLDDGADYWFWEAATSAGPRRRVACMTETTFHLHEVSVDAFQPMLDRLVDVGPDTALADAFVRIPVAAVDRVVREGTVVHIEGRSAGGPRRQTIDLADGADGVVEMLARRLPVVDGQLVQEPAH